MPELLQEVETPLAEAATVLHVDPSRLYKRWVLTGIIRGRRTKRGWLLQAADVETVRRQLAADVR